MPVKQIASFLSSRLSNRRARRAAEAQQRRSVQTRPGDGRSTFEPLESRRMMTVVLPGAAVPLPGTTAAAQPALAGLVVRDQLMPFSVNDGIGHTIFRGTLQDRVVRENGTGTLDFYQTIRADAGFAAPAVLQFVSRSSFGGWGVDANWRVDGLGNPTIQPERAARSVDGKTVRFDFGNDRINPGDMSLFYFAKTNAKAFDLNGGTAIGFGQGPILGSGNGSVKLTTAEPVAPETPGSVTGVVWHDVNGDGFRQATEPLLSNQRVYDDANHNGAFDLGEKTAFTNLIGRYTLGGLSPGFHQIREVNPIGTRITRPSSGVYNVLVSAGTNTASRDFGITRSVKISGTVFNDLDSDGFKDAGEGGLAGFSVFVDSNNNGVLDAGEKSTTTGASGTYAFNGLAGGVYHVRVQPKLFYTNTAPALGVHHMILPSGSVASDRNFGEHFRPIVIDPIPLPIPLPLPLPLPNPLPLPQPIPLPIPQPDPGPIDVLSL